MNRPAIALLALLVGCTTDGGAPDADRADAGPSDSGPADASRPDATPADSGTADAGTADSGSVDAGRADSGPVDSGPVDAGPVDADPVDAGPVDAGPTVIVEGGDFYAPLDPTRLPSHCAYPVTQATPCVGNASGAAGTTVTVPIFGLQPAHCDGILQANMRFTPDSALTLATTSESSNVCGRFESGLLWYCPWHFAPDDCSQFVAEGQIWLLTVSIQPGTPPGTYQLRPDGSIQGGDLGSGSGSSDTTCGSSGGPLDGGEITVTP